SILSRLSSRLALLSGGARDLPHRQQTLRATLQWSHDLLTEPDQLLFRRLAVFSGGCSLEAIEGVCNSPAVLNVVEAASSLVERSLLRAEDGPEDEPRLVMLETVHEYARELLEESGEAGDIHHR